MLADYLKKILNKDSFFYYVLAMLRRKPFALIRIFYCIWLSRKLTGLWWPVVVRISGRIVPVKIFNQKANVIIKGNLIIESWQNGNTLISISLGKGARLEIENDFIIGQGVKILVESNASLKIGGKNLSSGSGITCDTTILVSKSIEIGKDVIIAWGVFVTDSDWHTFNGEYVKKPVFIGDNVWISHDASILKGVTIGQGSIIGAKSLVVGAIPERCMAAGNPAKILKTNVTWAR